MSEEEKTGDQDPSKDFERWLTAGFAAASFTGLLQLSTLSPPSFGTPHWAAALSFSIGLNLSLIGLFLSIAIKGKLVQKELPPQWARRVADWLDGLVGLCALFTGAGAAMVATHLLNPQGDKLGWPTWIFIAGVVAILLVCGVLYWAARRHSQRKMLGT